MKASFKYLIMALLIFVVSWGGTYIYSNNEPDSSPELVEKPSQAVNSSENVRKEKTAASIYGKYNQPYRISDTFNPDVDAPVIIDTLPTENAVKFPVNKAITVFFSKKIVAGKDYKKILIKDSNNNVVRTTLRITGNKLIIQPVKQLGYGTWYTVVVPDNAVKDRANHIRTALYSYSFQTQATYDIIIPVITDTNPVKNAVDIAVDKVITITFSEKIIAGPGYQNVTVVDADNNVVQTTMSFSGKKLIVKPVSVLKHGTRYTVTVPGFAVMDFANNIREATYSFNFTTRKI